MASQESRDNYYADAAARAQLQATREALQFLRDQWTQQRADQQPWMRLGSGATDKLGFLMGIPGFAGSMLTAGAIPSGWTKGTERNWPGGGTPPPGSPPPPGDGAPPPDQTPPPGDGGGGPGGPGEDVPNWPSGVSPLALITGMAGASRGSADPGLVQVQAPDGEIRRMPRSQAQRFAQLGARIL